MLNMYVSMKQKWNNTLDIDANCNDENKLKNTLLTFLYATELAKNQSQNAYTTIVSVKMRAEQKLECVLRCCTIPLILQQKYAQMEKNRELLCTRWNPPLPGWYQFLCIASDSCYA